MRMFFSRRWVWDRGGGRSLQNQKLGRNQGVLYKMTGVPLMTPRPVLPTVASGGIGMSLPVIPLIVGMGFAPLPPAVADHLGVFGIGLTLAAPILHAASSLTLRPTANGLVRTVFGRLKGLLAIRAAAWWEKHFLRSMFGPQP